MSDEEITTTGDKCSTCGQEIWTTDEYDDMEDPITFCDPQCPEDGATTSEREA